MPFSFLAPLFLAGLAALAIPIVIHLTDRERHDVVRFPSLMFVDRIPHKTVRRQRIRHWVLFLLRCAAIVLLVMAFARPLVEGAGVMGAFTAGREVVILIDRSHSMAYGDRWDRAVAAARETINGLGDQDRGALIAFSDRAEALSQPSGDLAVLRALLAPLDPEDVPTRYGPALQLAAQMMEQAQLPRREVVLISDFQRTGWRPDDAPRLPAGVTVKAINVAEPGDANLAVTGLTIERTGGSTRDRVAVSARLVNAGGSTREATVQLQVDGQQVETRKAQLDPHGATTLHFAAVTVPRRVALGKITAGEDRLARDNQFFFVVAPSQAVRVVLMHHPRASASERVYLARALAIGSDPPFEVVHRTPSQLSVEDLEGRPAVVLNDVTWPGGAVGRRLERFVEEGGRLLIVLGPRATPAGWNNQRVFPGVASSSVDRWSDRGGNLSIVAVGHPVFEVFRAPRSGDFSTARFFRYRLVEPTDSATVLARYDDGGVALFESRVGAGTVLVLSTTLDNRWNDLPIQPVFLPFAHQLMQYLAGYGALRPWVTAGQVVNLADYVGGETAGTATVLDELVVETPSGERILRRFEQESPYLELREQGLYRVRPLDDRSTALATIAANLDPAETDLTVVDPEEVVGAVSTAGSSADQASAGLVLTPQERERRQGLWWYLLIGVILLLLAELTLSNRARRAPRR